MAIFSFLEKRRIVAVARQFAGALGPALAHDYGAGETYTAPQILAAIRRLGLPEHYAPLGLAAFMTKDAFVAAGFGDAPYDELRALFQRFRPPRPTSEHGVAGRYYDKRTYL